MIDFFQYAQMVDWHKREWLVAGKGPSLDISAFSRRVWTIALNHVIDVVDYSHIVHCVDIEAVSPRVVDDCDFLLMPYEPNVAFKRCGKAVTASKNPHIQKMNQTNRLICYNRVGSRARYTSRGPSVPISYFSAEGAIGCLAACGVQKIQTTGIDGGTEYHRAFISLTPLTNGRRSFDYQFPKIKALCKKYGATVEPLCLSH